MSNYSETLSALASQLSQLATSTSSDVEKNSTAVDIAQKILVATRGPTPDWMDWMISVLELIGLKIFLDWKALEMIPLEGSIEYADLAGKVAADEPLVRRLAWVLVSGGILHQIDEDKIAHTEKSRQYLPGMPNEILLHMMFEEHVVTALKLPEYFEQYGRREPATRRHTPYAFAHGQPEKEVWEIHQENPEQVKRFMKGMEMVQQFIPLAGIYDFSWVEAKLSEQHDRPILVDVGGSKGHVIKAIMKENRFLPADRIILQDRDEVIEQVAKLKDPELEGVQLQVHDFHKAQPVKNALIYWIRRCLHDYGDDDCAMMLTHLSDAMSSDSKVLVVEYVLPNPPPPIGAMTDFSMLGIGGKERTATDWELLIARSGLKIQEIHGLDMKMQVIECVKA
ncbi:O-methyltransferase [Colletotrichum orchidophilum]|uniref:O-methyltransferase n=1 Tax=Colletotrichum orchidophilum TaxID=1209926 RepID=A0A1G4BQZ3_9PEZI|nr:O-methyltransferase [Colletotrichum orchidophilum]OHF03869.1 O-methyltransferase [Colletotrichum orchidophilum]